MIAAGVSRAAGVSAFSAMFNGEPSQVLCSIGYFEDGDLTALGGADRELLLKRAGSGWAIAGCSRETRIADRTLILFRAREIIAAALSAFSTP
jgi:hypothetical protein